MNRHLIDTDVLIDHLRGQEKAVNFLKQLATQGSLVFYSVISKAEIFSGIRRNEEEAVASLFSSMGEILIDGEVAETAGRYRNKFHASHGLLLPDALIAASAKKTEAALVTLNKRHYPMDDVAICVPYSTRVGAGR